VAAVYSDEPVSPQQARFYRDRKEIARIGFANGWIIIDFFGSPSYPTVSASLSAEEYRHLVSVIWKGAQT
jgi:hypothetical protein